MNGRMRNQAVQSFFDDTDNYLEKSFGVRIRALIARELLGELTNARILDVGCGNGAVSLQYAHSGNCLTLIDLSDRMLELAIRNTPLEYRSEITYLNMDFHEFQPAELFDFVFCLGLLAHVPDFQQTINKLASFLTAGGYCVLQFTDQSRLISKINAHLYSLFSRLRDAYNYKINLITYAQIDGIIRLNGFRMLEKRRYSLLIPGMGRLPDSFLFQYQLMTLRNPWLSRMGSDLILLLSKG